MTRLTACTSLAAVAYATQGAVQVADQQSSESTTVGIEHLGLAAFSLSLVLVVPLVLAFGRLAARRGGATVAAAALVVLAALATVSNVRGSDPAFFAAVAAPANLLWLAGLVTLAVGLGRGGHVPAPVAVALPLTWVCTIPAAQSGGALLACVLWLALLAAFERRDRPVSSPSPLAA